MATYIVTTALDELDTGSTFEELSTGGLSLREAVALANASAGADTITFDGTVFTGGSASLIRLTMGEITISEEATIDGSAATGVTITGDANDDDLTFIGTDITDVASSGGERLADNTRVFHVSAESGTTTFESLTITGGHSSDTGKGGGGIYSLSDIVLADTDVSGNLASGDLAQGGGVFGEYAVTLTNSTVSGNATTGYASVGGGIAGDSVTLTDSVVSDNWTESSESAGGGIFSDTSVTLSNSTVSGNATIGSASGGGGIYASGTVTLTDSTISDNSTAGVESAGGGLFANGDVTLTASTISGNATTGESALGGGVYSGGDLDVTDSSITGNSTTGDDAGGGGAYASDGVTLSGSTVSNNSTAGDGSRGGGIQGTTVSLTNSTVSGNSTAGANATGGGAVGYEITVTNSTVSGNSTAGTHAYAGGIYGDASVTITNSIVSDNATAGDYAAGGGLWGGSITLTNSTVSGNSTAGVNANGGGAFGFDLIATNSTVSGNSAGGIGSYGGGLFGYGVALSNSTVSGNSADGGEAGGGGIYASMGGVSLENSIVLGNSSVGSPTPEIGTYGPINATGLNIVGTGSDTDGSDGIINADPTLVFAQTYANGTATAGVLSDNGGPVQTIALLADIMNPALDAASSELSTDARGGVRNVDLPGVGTDYSADLGAFELQALSQPTDPQAFVVTTMNDELDFNGSDATIESMGGLADLSLREAVFLANLAGGTADTITFDETVFTDANTNIIRLTMGEIELTDSLTIDGSGVDLVVITGDANGDDATLEGGIATDVAASSADVLDDNSRIFNITNWDAEVTLDSLAITGGRAALADGGDYERGGGSAYGGGILSNAQSLTISNSFIVGNTASGDYEGAGGGISANGLTLVNSFVGYNAAIGSEAWGGGISAGEVTLTNSSVSENFVRGGWAGGGGLSAGYALITSSTISNNSATGDYNGWAGGIDAFDVTIVNSTVSGNSASGGSRGQAGGIGAYEAEIIHSTITGNRADGGEEATGSGVAGYYVAITNSIVLGNDDGTPGSAELTVFGTVTADGLNIIGTGTDTDGSDGVINADPTQVFAQTYVNGAATAGVLADNGGPVQTVALKLDASNPALDRAADAPATDARGVSRVDLYGVGSAVVNFADLGAFEATDNAPTALALSNSLASIAENRSTASRIKVADIDVTDADGGPNTLSLAGADKGLFEIFNGDLYLKAGAKLDFETNPKLDVTVQVSADLNGPGIDHQVAFSLKVTDVGESDAALRIVGTRHKDVLTGKDGNDTILGLAGNDRIFGNAGNDRIEGGRGVDRMSGGDGDDVFVFRSVGHFGPGYDGPIGFGVFSPSLGLGKRDVITDFDVGHDTLDFSAIDANTEVAGNQSFDFLGKGNFSGAGSLIFRTFDRAGTADDRTIVYGDVDGNGLADFQLELTGIRHLTADSFIL